MNAIESGKGPDAADALAGQNLCARALMLPAGGGQPLRDRRARR